VPANPLVQLAKEIVFRVPTSMLPVEPAGVLFWVVMLLVWLQYRRMAKLEDKIHGFVSNNPLYNTATSALYGIAGGVVGSFLLVLGGVTLQQQDILYLWPFALLLMLVSPRFLCFSYAGGLVSLSHLAFGWPANINVASIMALVAILHMMEGLLVKLSGDQAASAVYVDRPDDADEPVVGAYLIQRFWPIPIMVVFLLQLTPEALGEAMDMPAWWPLIDIAAPAGAGWMRVIIPVVAALGYSDVAITERPTKRAGRSAVFLWWFSLILLALSLGAARNVFWAWLAALFAPLGHEAMVQSGNRREMQGKPIFVSPPDGVRIMDLRRGGPGDTLGLRRGDIILSVNGEAVTCRRHLKEALSEAEHLAVTVRREDECRVLKKRSHRPGDKMQVVTAPERGDRKHVSVNSRGILVRWARALFRRLF